MKDKYIHEQLENLLSESMKIDNQRKAIWGRYMFILKVTIMLYLCYEEWWAAHTPNEKWLEAGQTEGQS